MTKPHHIWKLLAQCKAQKLAIRDLRLENQQLRFDMEEALRQLSKRSVWFRLTRWLRRRKPCE